MKSAHKKERNKITNRLGLLLLAGALGGLLLNSNAYATADDICEWDDWEHFLGYPSKDETKGNFGKVELCDQFIGDIRPCNDVSNSELQQERCTDPEKQDDWACVPPTPPREEASKKGVSEQQNPQGLIAQLTNLSYLFNPANKIRLTDCRREGGKGISYGYGSYGWGYDLKSCIELRHEIERHLTAYDLDLIDYNVCGPKFVGVRNQFEDVVLKIEDPKFLLVPSEKKKGKNAEFDEIPTPGCEEDDFKKEELPEQLDNANHYLCYEIKHYYPQNCPLFALASDQFSKPKKDEFCPGCPDEDKLEMRHWQLKKPAYFCNPVEKTILLDKVDGELADKKWPHEDKSVPACPAGSDQVFIDINDETGDKSVEVRRSLDEDCDGLPEASAPPSKDVDIERCQTVFPIVNPDIHQLCYDISEVSLKGKKKLAKTAKNGNFDVTIRDQFGKETLKLKDATLFCVPSTKVWLNDPKDRNNSEGPTEQCFERKNGEE